MKHRTRSATLAVVSLMGLTVHGGCATTPAPAEPTADSTGQPAAESAQFAARFDPALTPFAAMAGRWRSESGGAVYEEFWLPPAGDNMTGAFRIVNPGGRATLFELITLSPVAGSDGGQAEGTTEPVGVRMRLRHFNAAMTPWASEADGPAEFVARDMPGGVVTFRAETGNVRAMVYDLSQPGRMTVTLDFGPERDPWVIPFERVD